MQVINSWKVNIFPVSADTAKQEFDRIYEKYGELTTQAVVDENRSESSPLHGCFEWRDDVAAEKYRQQQAGAMIRCLVSTVVPDEDKEPITVRSIVHTESKYEPISVAIRSDQKTAVLLSDALRDVEKFKAKYSQLSELKDVIDSMDQFAEKVSLW